MAENLGIIGVATKCSANCVQKATTTLFINGQDFQFCDHHTAKYQEPIRKYEEERLRTAYPIVVAEPV